MEVSPVVTTVRWRTICATKFRPHPRTATAWWTSAQARVAALPTSRAPHPRSLLHVRGQRFEEHVGLPAPPPRASLRLMTAGERVIRNQDTARRSNLLILARSRESIRRAPLSILVTAVRSSPMEEARSDGVKPAALRA